MKKLFALTIFSLFATITWAQTNPFASKKYVAFDPPGHKRVYYGIGDEIYLKFEDENHYTPWVITNVTDSGFVLEGQHFVTPTMPTKIKVYPERKLRMLKRILIYGGAALPTLMLLNYAISPSQSRVFVPAVGGIAGGMLVTWFILKSFDWAGMRYKITKERPLKMINLDMKSN